MRSRLLLALFVLPAGLLCASAPAQEVTVTKPDPTSKPTPQQLEQEKAGEVQTPEQRLAELRQELDKLQAELA